MSGSQPQPSTSSGARSWSARSKQEAGQKTHLLGEIDSKNRPLKLECTGSVDDSSALNCPICFEFFTEAVMTRCGHTFCDTCIRHSLSLKPVCPKCGTNVDVNKLYPNFTVNEMVARRVSAKALKSDLFEAAKLIDAEPSSVLQLLSGNNYNELNLNNIRALIILLQRKEKILTVGSEQHQRALVLEFLKELLKVEKTQKEQVDKIVHLIEQDLTHINSLPPVQVDINETNSGSQSSVESMPMSGSSSSDSVGFNTQELPSVEPEKSSLRRMRMSPHMEELMRIYIRRLEDTPTTNTAVPSDDGGDSLDFAALDDFSEILTRISRYSELKPLATLSFSAELLTNSNTVSSIEFDKDNEFLAIAGLPGKIKIFEYAAVIGCPVNRPTAEISCIPKITCVAWNKYYKNRLASSDYDGCVHMWDVNAASKIWFSNEHEKKVWSVDFSNGNPRLLASGSDDSKVKLWSKTEKRSVITLTANDNVCSVKFCPQNSHVVAFGCADHCIYYYDFRQPRDPIDILHGHRKTVSAVKFASKDELVSASTDGYLKFWNRRVDSTEKMECVNSFTSHTNVKHLIGLATDGNYIACGSEDNSLYIYDKQLSKQLFSYKFEYHTSMQEFSKHDGPKAFVSAVTWKKDSPLVVASSSDGTVKFLELI